MTQQMWDSLPSRGAQAVQTGEKACPTYRAPLRIVHPTMTQQMFQATAATRCTVRLLAKQDQRVCVLSLLFNSPKDVPPDSDLVLEALRGVSGGEGIELI